MTDQFELLPAMMPTGWHWDITPWFVPGHRLMAVRRNDATVIVAGTEEELLRKVRYVEMCACWRRGKQRESMQ